MALMNRLSILVPNSELEPEDFLHASLGVIFTDDAAVQHGDPDHELVWTSPHLPNPFRLTLAEPPGRHDRYLFSHYLWNASLLLAEFVEAGSLGVPLGVPSGLGGKGGEKRPPPPPSLSPSSPSSPRDDSSAESTLDQGREGDPPAAQQTGGGPEQQQEEQEQGQPRQEKEPTVRKEEEEAAAAAAAEADDSADLASLFDVTARRVLELGAGTALPSLVSAAVGAPRVAVTDYPSPAIIGALARNVRANAASSSSSSSSVEVHGHRWGDVEPPDDFAARGRGAFDRVFACDCLWMPWQHANLRRSIAWFLSEGAGARAFVVAGFHTGREQMRGFFDAEALRAEAGLEVERIWERDCDGLERDWVWDRGPEDIGIRKRWLVVAVLRRVVS